eukprot:s1830_g10.t1
MSTRVVGDCIIRFREEYDLQSAAPTGCPGRYAKVTSCEIDPGEELLLCYGQFSNAELLFNAGFTCWPNEHDCLMVSPAELLASAKECWEGDTPDLQQRLHHLDAQPARLTAAMPLLGRGIPAKTITVLSGLLIDEEQWKELVEKGGDGELHDAWVASSTEGHALRMAVLGGLLRLLRGVVAPRFKATSMEADAEVLRRQNALRVRLGERQVLQRLEMALETRKASLEDASKRPRLEKRLPHPAWRHWRTEMMTQEAAEAQIEADEQIDADFRNLEEKMQEEINDVAQEGIQLEEHWFQKVEELQHELTEAKLAMPESTAEQLQQTMAEELEARLAEMTGLSQDQMHRAEVQDLQNELREEQQLSRRFATKEVQDLQNELREEKQISRRFATEEA